MSDARRLSFECRTEKWRWLMYINPLTGIVEGIRSVCTAKHFQLDGTRFHNCRYGGDVNLVCSHISPHRKKSFADLI